MRFIQKNPAPTSFTDWKQQAGEAGQLTRWNALKNPQKTDVLISLIQEQGHICCYCGQRINKEHTHIEHLKPRSEFHNEMFDYENFLASCPGDTEAGLSPKFQAHFLLSSWLSLILCAQPLHIVGKQYQEFCGQKKGDWYDPTLMVSPLDPHCTAYFRYTAVGEILPTTNAH
jgi:uncharacterized protein (TIGR02646 family)